MTNLTQLILHVQEARGMLALVERELKEYQDEQRELNGKTRDEARAELRARFEDARNAREYPPVYAIQWLNTEERMALATRAGFKKIWDAADWLNGVRA